MVNDMKFVTMLQKHQLSLALQLKIPTKQIINLTAAKNSLFTFLNAINALKKHVGQTVDEFRRRSNNYKSNDSKFQRLESCMQEHLFSHFSLAGHDGFFNNVSITFIDKTDPSDPLRREDYWKQTLKQ